MAYDARPLREFLELQVETEQRKLEIGKEIRFARESRGMTQVAAAAALGVSNAYLSQIESGARTPSPETMTSIVNYFSTTGGAHATDQDQEQE